MSKINKVSEDENNNIKKYKSACTNFIKMLAEEKTDSIRISYFSGLTKMPEKLGLSPEKTVEIIFKNILFERIDILKSPSLLLAFISFCKKTHEITFLNNFFDLLYIFAGDYDKNKIYFKEYLIPFSLEIFFESFKNKENPGDFEKRRKYFNLLIYSDIKEFKEQFFKMVINNNLYKLVDNKIKINYMIDFFEIIINRNKYSIGIMLLKTIIEEINNKNVPQEIIDNIINFENKNGFNDLVKKKKDIDDFLTFNKIILDNISKEFINEKNNDKKLDIYLTNMMNILCIKKEFNVEIIKHIFDYFINHKYTMLNKMFSITIYYLSNYAYTINQILFLFNTICKYKQLNPIYKWVIYKNPILSKKTILVNTDFILDLKDINIIIEGDSKNKKYSYIDTIIDNSLLINEEESNLYLLINLSLYDYIINSSFKYNQNTFNINFYSLNKILDLISSLSIEKMNKLFYKEFIQFLIDYLSVLYEFCYNKEISDFRHKKIIIKTIKSFISIFKKAVKSKDEQLSILFPSLINIIGSKNAKIELIEPIIDYLIDIFARNSRQAEMIFKLIKSFLNNDNIKNFDKFFPSDKLIDLVIKANEHKLFETLFYLEKDLIKTKNEFTSKLYFYIINKYSKFYSGALSDLLQRYIIAKFDETYLQKTFSINEINDEYYYIINTIDNIFLQDKPTNLKEIVEQFYGDNYKKIIDIFDKLFEYMDKEGNNQEIFKSNLKENDLVHEYYFMKDNLEDILNYYSFFKKDYEENNDSFKKNRKLYCIYGTTYYLIHLLTQYLSEKIENEKIIENEEEKKKENDKLMLAFDYIYEKVLLNKDIKNITFKSFFLNSILSEQKVLDYYLVKHTNNLVNIQIKENEQDFSQLDVLSYNINSKKSFELIKLLTNNPYNIILINKLILELFNYESNVIINPQRVDLYKNQKENKSSYLLITNIYENQIFEQINKFYSNNNEKKDESNIMNKDNQMRINSCFSYLFFKRMTDLGDIKNLESYQIYYLFCLDNEIFYKYYSSFNEFYNLDLTLLQIYSLVRNKNCIFEIKEKFLDFLQKFIFIKSIYVFSLRIFSEVKTFEKLISKSDIHSEKEISILCDIITSIFENLVQYNSYQNYTEDVTINLINNIFSFTDKLLNLKKDENEDSIEIISNELKYLGNLINYIIEEFSTDNKNQLNKNKISKGINNNLIKNINKFLGNKITYDINKNNGELFNFLKSQKNLIKNENKEKRMDLIDNNELIDNYLNNPEGYPFPIEQFMNKYNENK